LISRFLDGLNPQQRQAAEHFEGPLLVLAGAGSGKTRVLTSRIAHLIDEFGVDPGAILALTFTNKAAAEMRQRLCGLLGREPSGIWAGTFHAIGARILRRHATLLGWKPDFLIYDAEDAEALIKRILKDQLGLDLKQWSPRAVRSTISSAKNELVDDEAYAERAFDQFGKVVAEVFGRYARSLKGANAFDFDDLLVRPVELLRSSSSVLDQFRRRFRFVLVDEYQDTNHAQYVFLRLLTGSDGPRDVAPGAQNLFVVGDDDQSIYGWRGANIRNILDFEKDFPAAKLIRLEQNYRSTQKILEAANRVIARNVRRKGKNLHTVNVEGEGLTLVETADEVDEARWISREIRTRLAMSPELAPRDLVVLYRTNAQSRVLEEALLQERLPYRVIGGTRFYERREVKDVLAYLRLTANPAADEAFLRIVNVPRRGVGDASVARLAEWASTARVPLLRAAEHVHEIPGIGNSARRSLVALADLIRKHAALADQGLSLDETIRALASESGLLEMYEEEGPDGIDRVANIKELVAGAAELRTRLESGDPELVAELEELGDVELRPLDIFLTHVALVSDVDQHDPNADAVSLMTMHNAKGLEFPIVFVAGLEEGLFPLSRALAEPEELEEERRLFYVGITRAERKLYLTMARRRRRGAEWMDSIASSFLEALPPESLELRQTRAVQDRTVSRRFGDGFDYTPRRRSRLGFANPAPTHSSSYQVDYSDSQDAPRLVKGARVRHPQFGSGSVVEISGIGSDVRATIDFDEIGRKKVVLRYANLESDWD
jgi:DNA helicase II / ATP-dependent DNA helicase PcrA